QNPEKPDLELIDMRHEKVTVPAGSFDSTYIKAKNKADGKITEQWANPQEITVVGMIKTSSETQFGKMDVVLTSFQKK
ncbi:MAG: hypothetical protein KDD25_03870, partial [Bdellovibrionales bacterium]|nr:hypothetical protein [Bdellovibrionales bacterium]